MILTNINIEHYFIIHLNAYIYFIVLFLILITKTDENLN